MRKNKVSVILIVSASLLALLTIIYLLVSGNIFNKSTDEQEKNQSDNNYTDNDENSSENTGTDDTDKNKETDDDSTETDDKNGNTTEDNTDVGVSVTVENAIILKKNTDIYTEPDADSEKAGKLTANSVIRNFESKNDEWYYVEYNGISGYAKKTDCSKEKTYYIPQDVEKAEPIDAVIRELDAAKPMIALTFDDGPGKFTDKLLDALERNNQRVSFFVIGKNIQGREETLKRAYSLGCLIGNHTYNHVQLTKLSEEDIIWQVNACEQLIKKLIPQEKIPFRAPYCAYNDNIRKLVHAPLLHWSVDTLDWKLLNADKVYENVMASAKDGEVILMHDALETSVDAAVRLVDDLTAQGYQLVTVYELAYYRGVTLEDGEVYRKSFH